MDYDDFPYSQTQEAVRRHDTLAGEYTLRSEATHTDSPPGPPGRGGAAAGAPGGPGPGAAPPLLDGSEPASGFGEANGGGYGGGNGFDGGGGYGGGNGYADGGGSAGLGLVAAAAAVAGMNGAARPPAARRHGKLFCDPVHGQFWLEPLLVDVIDTPPFQRLRDLHQLGLAHLVFPGATHTRFEHSLGVAHKAFEAADRMHRMQGGQLGMERRDCTLVALAGLCHDLGHGPFSHVFEYEFLRRKIGSCDDAAERKQLTDWHHEAMSGRILEHLVDTYNVEGIDASDIRRVTALIRGQVDDDCGFIFDIVANKRNSVDVDKVDYLQRDAHYCGVRVGCDFARLLSLTKVIDNEICFKWTEYSNLVDLFHARESMHRKVYTHRKTKAVEFMVADALVEADGALRFSERIHDPREFCGLNDSLINTIENFDTLLPRGALAAALDAGAERRLRAAQAILTRLRRRQLYRFGAQFTAPPELLQDSARLKAVVAAFTPAAVAAAHRPGNGGVALRPEDVIVHVNKIDHTQDHRSPLDSVHFFREFDDTAAFPLDRMQVMGIVPQYHQERTFRVYTPVDSNGHQEAVGSALEAWMRSHVGSAVKLATPARPAPPGALAAARRQVAGREAAIADADPRRGPGAAASRPRLPSGLGPRPASGGSGGGAGPWGSSDARLGGGAAAAAQGPAAGVAGSGGGDASRVAGSGSAGGGGGDVSLGAGMAGGSATGGGGGGGGSTPTRSSHADGAGAAAAAEGSQAQAAAEAGGGGGGGGGARGGRAKRPRSSASLFPEPDAEGGGA